MTAKRHHCKQAVEAEAQQTIADAEQVWERAAEARHRNPVLETEAAMADDYASLPRASARPARWPA